MSEHPPECGGSSCPSEACLVRAAFESRPEPPQLGPRARGDTNDALIRCIEGCYDCAQACTACADACLGEDTIKELTQCIRLNLDFADVCTAAGALASRRTGSDEIILKSMIDACAQACQLCG